MTYARRYRRGTPRCVLICSNLGNYHAARAARVASRKAADIHVVEVLARSSYPEFRADPHQVVGFPVTSLGLIEPLTAQAARKPLHDALARLSPDVVFAPGWSMMESLLAIEWCVAYGVPVVMMSDSSGCSASRHHIKEIVKRRMLSLAQTAFVAGGPQANYVAALGMPRPNIFLGYDAVDNEYFARNGELARRRGGELRAELGLPDAYFFVCARLIPEKNLKRLVDAFAAYRNRVGPDPWPMIIAGPGPLQAELEAQIANRGLAGHVKLLGACGYDVMPSYYALAGAAILASVSETWGLAVNEAMAAGLPVLVSERCGCARDLVQEGRNGFVFDPLDIDTMATAMLRVSSADCDRAAMGRASREIVADWGLDRFAAGFEAAAHAALAEPVRRPSVTGRAILRAMTAR